MLKGILRDLTPPILWRALQKMRRIRGHAKGLDEWAYIPEGWAYARSHPEIKGWNVAEILAVYKRKWPRFVALVEGTGPLGVAHESDLSTNDDVSSHNSLMSFAYAIALATHHLESWSFLDWGGGIGHYYLLARALLPDLTLEYHCKDTPLLAEYGARLFPGQHFYSDLSCLERTYDFVMASTSLHYEEDWPGLLMRLAKATRSYLYITGLPTVFNAPSFVFVQRPYSYGYNTEYLGWCLNYSQFVEEAGRADLALVREFVIGVRPLIHKAPEQCQYRGFLFRRTASVLNGAWKGEQE